MNKSWLWYLILLQCNSFFCSAQSNRIPFEHIGIAEGLSESNILSIVQDNRGFMWFGSWDGLNKYDGYKITVYKNKPGDSSSISNNYVNEISEDKNGNLWVATNEGLNYFDRYKEVFRRFRHADNNVNSIRHNIINSVLADRQGKVWIGTMDGLDRYDPVKNKFEHLNVLGSGGSLNTTCGVKKIYEDSHGNIWVCNLNENGISLFDQGRNTFLNIRHTASGNSIGGNNINTIFEDSRNRLWFGTNGNGLDLYDASAGSFRHFKHDDNNVNSIVTNVVLAINEDADHNVWVSTENGGLSVFNDVAGKYFTYRHDEIDKESISNNSVYCIYKDDKGNMWLGNFAGWIDMAISDKLLFTHYKHTTDNNSLSNNQVLSIMEDSKKKIWLATDGGGLDVFDPATGYFEHYRHKKNNSNTIAGDNVLNTLEDSKGNTWIGTWVNGITVMNARREVIKHFKHDPADPASLSSNNAWKIFEDRDKNIWIGTYGGGLELLNPDGKTFTHFKHSDADNNSIAGENIVNILEDRQGNLWLCTESKGLDLLDRKQNKFTHFRHNDRGNSISNNNINSVYEDDKGNLWIGTMDGLNFYNRETGLFTIYKVSNGLAGDYVFGILEDAKKNLWISTNNGISRFDLLNRTFENYSVTDGIQSTEFKQLAVCKTGDGMMYFGGINGFNQFLPGSIRRKSFDPPLVFTDFTVFNKKIPVALNSNMPSTLTQSISETKSIILPYSSSVFSFEFASLNYTGKERKRYEYMLEGFDKGWIEAGISRTATYTNLDPGSYIFKVKGLNNEGNPSPGVATIQLTIKPPFWLTWWFRIIVVFTIIGIFLVIYTFRVKAIKQQKKELEKQVNAQTYQLQVAALQERKARQEAENAHVETILANAALERSEYRYSTLFHESPQPKWVYDIDSLRIVQVNKAAVAHYGYSEEEFLTRTVIDLIPDDEQLNEAADSLFRCNTNKNAFTARQKHIKKCGEIIEVELHGSTISINNKEYKLFIAIDITEKILFENKLAKAIIKTQEDERYEIGSELHDNICQILACSQMNISMLNHSLPDSLKLYYENSKMYTKQALDEIRNLSHRLAPSFLGEAKFEDIISKLAASINIDKKYEISVYFYDSVRDELLSRDIQLTAYRILQEQLRNIVKYAHASEICIDVMITAKNELEMQTSDNGIGFNLAAINNGIGIANMKRRAELFSGSIDFDTAPGRGCCITVIIPLQNKINEQPAPALK
ncbi:sensor histidine kinase [Ferruginibacter profundus]